MTYLESAIIGYWRQGAKIEEIEQVTGLDWIFVCTTLLKYFKNYSLW